MILAIETGQSFHEITTHWSSEDVLTALYYLDDKADRIKDAQRRRH